MTSRIRLTLLALFALTLMSSCVSMLVDSEPRGMHIFVNGQDTGYVTPRKFKESMLERVAGPGPWFIEVKRHGYQSTPPVMPLQQEFATSRLVFSILLPPFGLANVLFRGFSNFTPQRMNFIMTPDPQADKN